VLVVIFALQGWTVGGDRGGDRVPVPVSTSEASGYILHYARQLGCRRVLEALLLAALRQWDSGGRRRNWLQACWTASCRFERALDACRREVGDDDEID
jgi:hypothetical protein